MADVAYDAASSGASAGAVATFTYAHTTGSGTNRVLYVGVWWNNDPGLISAATYAGVTMTPIVVTTNGSNVIRIYRLVAPTSGANNIVFTWTNARSFNSCAISVENAHQTITEGTIVEEQSGDESIAPTTPVASMVVDFILQLGNTDLTASAPLTERVTQTGPFSTTRWEAGTAARSGATTTCAWTSDADVTIHIGIPVLTAAQELTQSLASTLALDDSVAAARTLVVGPTDSISLSDTIQAPHTDLSPPAEIFTDPEELGEFGDWEDQDLAPGDTPVWTETVLTPVTWTQADSDNSGTPLTPIECAETLSDMFCDRDYPPFEAPTDCTIFSPVVVTAGSIGRLAQHSVEEIPDTDLIVGLASPGTTPHDTVALVELESPYSSATKQTLEATNPTYTDAVGRMNPFTKSFVVMYPFLSGASDRLVRYQSVPWDGSAYDYGSVVSYDVDIPNSGDGADFRSFGLVPLKDGRWLSCYDDTTSDELYWNYSEDDGETWSAFQSQDIGEGLATFLLLCADGIPIIVYSTALAGTPGLYARALVDDVWGTALQIDDAINNNQSFSLATIEDSKRFQVFYNETGTTTVKVKFCTVTGEGTLALADTETVVDVSPTGFSGVWATYHPVATAGAKWFVLVSTTDGNVTIYKRLDADEAADTWSSTALGAIANPGFMLPAIPRCAASIPIFQWISGNTITIRRVAS